MRTAALVLTALLAAPATAHAGELGRLGLGESIDELVADPAGGAWTLGSRRIDAPFVTRFDAGRPARRAQLRGFNFALTLGPDGLAWVNPLRGPLRRVDRQGRPSIAAELPFRVALGIGMASGPDGRLWGAAADGTQLARITPGGVVSMSPFPVPGCENPDIGAITRAADGAMWLADGGCNRLIRVPHEGAPSVIGLGALRPTQLEPDPSGGVWFAAAEGVLGHSGGARHSVERISDFAVTPDGTVWIANGTCTLQRLGGAAVPAPTRVIRLERGPAGLVVAGPTRVFDGLEGGPCDDQGPKVTVRPRRLSLAAFKRGELRITVREPTALEFYVDDPEFGHAKLMRTAGTWRVKPTRATLRHLRGKRQFLFILHATDADGNEGGTDGYIRLTMR